MFYIQILYLINFILFFYLKLKFDKCGSWDVISTTEFQSTNKFLEMSRILKFGHKDLRSPLLEMHLSDTQASKSLSKLLKFQK